MTYERKKRTYPIHSYMYSYRLSCVSLLGHCHAMAWRLSSCCPSSALRRHHCVYSKPDYGFLRKKYPFQMVHHSFAPPHGLHPSVFDNPASYSGSYHQYDCTRIKILYGNPALKPSGCLRCCDTVFKQSPGAFLPYPCSI